MKEGISGHEPGQSIPTGAVISQPVQDPRERQQYRDWLLQKGPELQGFAEAVTSDLMVQAPITTVLGSLPDEPAPGGLPEAGG